MSNYDRAKKIVEQIKNGEWVGDYNDMANEVYCIEKGDVKIWIANGGFFCKGYKPKEVDLFGLVWRHWVWFVAQKICKQALKEARLKMVNEFMDDI